MIKNAKIMSAEIEIMRGCCLTVNMTVDYGVACQGLGDRVLYLQESCQHHQQESIAGHYINSIMEIAGVEKWSDVVGCNIRVDGDNNKIVSIGHIIKDNWFKV